MRRLAVVLLAMALAPGAAGLRANPPVASYLFPAGGQRGATVAVRVGGLFLYGRCGFELEGPGVSAPPEIHSTPTRWLEGPLLPIPDSQRAEDYPRDMAATVSIAADAPLGVRRARVWTAEGVASGPLFEVGELPEVVEEEVAGDPFPVGVRPPVTINGRIFPRQDVDLWTFAARKGDVLTCRASAAALGSPLDARLVVLDPEGRLVCENDDALGKDPLVRFTAPADGTYQVQIQDADLQGSQAHVYRLTIVAGPALERVFPLGGRRGETARVRLFGPGMPAEPVPVSLPADAPAEVVYRHPLPGRHARPVVLDVDDLPEHLEGAGPPEKSLPVPGVLNGTIATPGEQDAWGITATPGETLELALRASRLGSPLVGALRVTDAAGKELARAEGGGKEIDPALTVRVPADGKLTLHVADRFASRGGPAFAYRLRVAAAPPDFQLRLPGDTVVVPRAGQVKLRVSVLRQGGFKGPVGLRLEGLPGGVQVKGDAQIRAGQGQVELVLTAEARAAIGISRVRILGSAEVGGAAQTRQAVLVGEPGQPQQDTVLLAVVVQPPFKLVSEYRMQWSPRGSTLRKHYRIERGDFKGPLTLSLADRQARHLQGVTGPVLTVPPEVSEVDYPVQLPPWMETGRTCRVCVMAVGKVRDGGREYEVGFSAAGQNDQMVTVIETGRLGLELGRGSVGLSPGGKVPLSVRIARGKGLAGPVRVELAVPGHVRGIRAEPLVVAAGQERGELALALGGEGAGPFNMPLTVRATLDTGEGPVIAEAPLEVVPAEDSSRHAGSKER